MEAKAPRNIRNGREYDSLIPAAALTQQTVRRGATVSDTIAFIPKVVNETCWHTKRLANLLRGRSLYETCQNIWNFVYHHIRYHKDDEGLEQIRSPARGWHDRFRGIDCDCYTVFISTLLTNLKIPHRLRIVKYKKDTFQHIYPIVPTGNGQYITIDCVVDQYNYEEPFTEKKDTTMDLQYLNGTDDQPEIAGNTDTDDLFGEYDEDLGRRRKRRKEKDEDGGGDGGGGGESGEDGDGKKKKRHRFGNFLKKGLHILNRLNPATVLLRNGVLAAMKLNMFKIAQRLKWAYLSEEEAKKKEVDPEKWKRLVKIKEKLEKIFYGAGGKEENFKKAILKGKGNKNHEVNGLGYIPDEEIFGMDERTSLRKVLGEELWHSENVDGMDDFEGLDGIGDLGDLGELATGASIAAATSALAAIAGLLKKIGNIFPKKSEASGDFENTAKDDDEAMKKGGGGGGSGSEEPGDDDKSGSAATTKSATVKDGGGGEDGKGGSDADKGGGGDPPVSFWEKHKKWLKPTLMVLGGLGIVYLGYRMVSGSKKNSQPRPAMALSGIRSRKKTGHHKNSHTHAKPGRKKRRIGKGMGKKKPIALL